MSLDYTPDRYQALHLVSTNKISSIDAVLQRNDGGDLEPGVFASLLALRNEGYIKQHLPPAGMANSRHWPARLSMRGIQLLSQFNLEHGRQAASPSPDPGDATVTTAPEISSRQPATNLAP